MQREFIHVQNNPIAGDIVEVFENVDDGDESFKAEVMLRVISVAEGYVWYKEYGLGRPVCSLAVWRQRLGKVIHGQVIRLGDESIPF